MTNVHRRNSFNGFTAALAVVFGLITILKINCRRLVHIFGFSLGGHHSFLGNRR